MYKNILVPLDGSKRAEVILSHAEEMARCTGASIILLQVVELHAIYLAPNVEPLDLQQDTMAQSNAAAHAYLASVEKSLRAKGIHARSCVEEGPVVEAIINTATDEGADLIAMASHGRTGLARVFYGSVAAGVLQRVDRPLLLIRSREPS
jgi:nucleotide-binding universal stress UspA family protein